VDPFLKQHASSARRINSTEAIQMRLERIQGHYRLPPSALPLLEPSLPLLQETLPLSVVKGTAAAKALPLPDSVKTAECRIPQGTTVCL